VFNRLSDESLNPYKILERLAEKGHLQNTQQFEGREFDWSHTSSYVKVICSMKNLEKLTSNASRLTLKDLALVFQSCTKLIELDIFAFKCYMDEDIKNRLRSGFQTLRRLRLAMNVVNLPCPVMQEMLT
jgi:hypothetical protein